MSISVHGLCRFSYPSKEGSGFHNKNVESLYDSRRLTRRLGTFENILIPSISNQSDKNFKLGLLIGDDLPTWCRDRLLRACRNTPQIELIVKRPGLPHRDACSSAIQSLRNNHAGYVAEFRLDDDDGVSKDFIESIKRISSKIPDGAFGPIIEINFPKGYHIHIGSNAHIRETVMGHLTCAQAWIISVKTKRTMFNYHHYNFWRRGTCISMPQNIMYLRGVHDFNDTNININPEDLKNWTEYQADLKDRFNINAGNIAAMTQPLQ